MRHKSHEQSQPAAVPIKGSSRWRFSWSDAAEAIGHALVTCISVVPVAFQAAEQKVLPAVFASGLTGLLAFAASAAKRFLSDTRR